MTRLKRIIFSTLVFLSMCGAALADLKEKPPKHIPTLWEPVACLEMHNFVVDEDDAGRCMHALYQLAQAASAAGNHDLAIARYGQILTIKPYPLVFAHRGTAYAAQKQFRAARTDYYAALAMMPGFDTVWWALALLDYKEGRFGAALENINHAIAIKAGEAGYFEFRASVYDRFKKKKLSADDMKTAAGIRAKEKEVTAAKEENPQAAN